MRKRQFLQTAAAALLACSAFSNAFAQNTPLKFQLDWRFEGPAAFFVHPEQKGYFKEVGLDVTVEAAAGAGAIQRVASGTHDLGFADMAALMEFHANNPDAPIKPVAVMVIYNTTPASVMALKKSGITKASELTGKKLVRPFLMQAAAPSPSLRRPMAWVRCNGPPWTHHCAKPCWRVAISMP